MYYLITEKLNLCEIETTIQGTNTANREILDN